MTESSRLYERRRSMPDMKVTDAMIALIRTVFKDDETLDAESQDVIRNNTEEIYKIAKCNDMAHLIGYALEKADMISPDNKYFVKLQEQTYLAIFRYEGMAFELERMREELERAEICFIPLKGAVIRSLYPEGWMRTSSDIDILVRPEDIERASEVLTSKLGYNLTQESTHDYSFFTEGGIHIELHFDLVEAGRANSASEVLSDVWKHARAVNGKNFERELEDGMFYFYHIAHLAKHLEVAGAGMRPVIDLWLINNRMERDEKSRFELLSRCSLDKFASFCDELAEKWMGEKKEISSQAEKLGQFILGCGIYGSEENRIIISKGKNGGTFRYILSRLFLPYETLALLYPIIKKQKWLFPFCQVARWFKLLSGNMAKKAIGEVKMSSSTTAEELEEMERFMSEIGL